MHEQLSEGVSKFTLYVVEKRDQAAPIPPSLNEGVGRVGGQCETVCSVCGEISSSFADFPEIRSKIDSECASLSSSGRNLISTASNMGRAGESLADSWQRLANVCCNIANNVISLMEVLYDAELRRIFITADRSAKLLSETKQMLSDPAFLSSNSDAAAEKLSAAASEVSQIAQYMRDLANNEELPEHKKDLLIKADQLSKLSEQLINNGNQVLSDPSNAPALSSFSSLNNQVNSEIKLAMTAIKQVQEQRRVVKPISQSIPRGSPSPRGAPRGSASPRGAPRSPDHAGRGAGAVPVSASSSPPVSRSGPEGRPQSQQIDANWQPKTMDQVAQGAEKFADNSKGKDWMDGSDDLSREIRKLAEAAKTGKGSELLAAARRISELTLMFSARTQETASRTANPGYKNQSVSP